MRVNYIIKYSLLVIYFLCAQAIAATYQYPKIIDVNIKCNVIESNIKKVKGHFSNNEECPNSKIKISAVDLNNDKICEYLITDDWGRRVLQ